MVVMVATATEKGLLSPLGLCVITELGSRARLQVCWFQSYSFWSPLPEFAYSNHATWCQPFLLFPICCGQDIIINNLELHTWLAFSSWSTVILDLVLYCWLVRNYALSTPLAWVMYSVKFHYDSPSNSEADFHLLSDSQYLINLWACTAFYMLYFEISGIFCAGNDVCISYWSYWRKSGIFRARKRRFTLWLAILDANLAYSAQQWGSLVLNSNAPPSKGYWSISLSLHPSARGHMLPSMRPCRILWNNLRNSAH